MVVCSTGDCLELTVRKLLLAVPEIRKHHQSIEIRSSLDELDSESRGNREPQLIANSAARITQELLAKSLIHRGSFNDLVEGSPI